MELVSAEEESRFRAHLAARDLRRAAEWLVRSYGRDVLGLCIAMVRDRAAAEDLAQDVFSRAFGSLEGYRGEASARTWILAVARNRCFDHLRQLRRDPWAGAPAGDDSFDEVPDEVPLSPELLMRRDDVEQALGTLSEGERALIVLRYRNGLEYDELAAAFGLREGAVRMRISRALARMRVALEERDRAPGAAPGFAPPAAAPAPAPFGPPPAARSRAMGVPPRVMRAPAPPSLPALLDGLTGELSAALSSRLLAMASALPTV